MDSKRTVPNSGIPFRSGGPVAGTVEHKWQVLSAIGVGTFMSALDAGAINAILPVVNRALGSTVATIEWVVTIYLLMIGGLLLSFGRLGDLRGHKAVYVSGFAVFVLGSALCGLARTAGALIAFRALQAMGAAMLFANSPAILTKNFPAAERGKALGLQATMTYLGLTVGPSLGGWLTTGFTWRAIFYLNIPIGILALWFSVRFIPSDPRTERRERFDLVGGVIWMSGLIALLLALNKGHAWGWTSLAVLALFVLAALMLSLFVIVERRAPDPMLDLSLFRHASFSTAVVSAVLNYICIYCIVFLLPFYLIQGRGLSPAHAGLVLTAQPLMRALLAPLSGALSDRIGSRFPCMMGMGTLAVGLSLLSRLGPDSPLSNVVVALAIAGLGAGLFISPNSSALMGSAPRHRQGIAAGVLATARNVGTVLGVGLAGAIFTTVLSHGTAHGSSPALFEAVDLGFLVASCAAALGVLTSAFHQRPLN